MIRQVPGTSGKNRFGGGRITPVMTPGIRWETIYRFPSGAGFGELAASEVFMRQLRTTAHICAQLRTSCARLRTTAHAHEITTILTLVKVGLTVVVAHRSFPTAPSPAVVLK
jgi:hypothetical protein